MAQNFRRTQFLRTTIVEAYTKRRLPHDLVIRHPQVSEAWNQWRQVNRQIEPDLNCASLCPKKGAQTPL